MTSAVIAPEKKIRPLLGGHETFAFRNGWLKKGVDAVISNNYIFLEDDSLVTLGVGKNMVRSIRHWCLASGLLEEMEGAAGRSRPLKLTNLAVKLMMDHGWDPYFEREGSLWLIHWQVASNHTRSLVWNIAFSEYHDVEFSRLSIANFIAKQFDRLGFVTTREMIHRELDCFLHTYVNTKSASRHKRPAFGLSEENLDCPLAELDLIRFLPEYDLFHFNVGPKYSLPAEIFGYSLLQFTLSNIEKRRTIALEDCIYKAGSPGQIFKLDENSVVDYLVKLENLLSGSIQLVETAGLPQIYLADHVVIDPEDSARMLLQSYYE